MAVQRKFDAIHDFYGHFAVSPRSSTVRYGTIIPIVMNDDALGDPMSFNANPEHASWAEVTQPNCYPDSEIRNMNITIDIWTGIKGKDIHKHFIDYGLIVCAFPEDLDALDEKSGLTLKEVLELQHESTDRQCYPLWNTVDMLDGSTLASNVPGLTGGQVQEAVVWDTEVIRDQLRYGKIKGLLRKILVGGLRTTSLRTYDKVGGHKKLTFRFTPSAAKFINPYTFFGIAIKQRQISATLAAHNNMENQPSDIFDIGADAGDINFSWHVHYNERNPEFHMAKV